ncbi:MAG: helix-hairpin-helix domain-containing protein [Candidatus Sericytochromatia bacterium]|nr:helix-hairpin-helix domain-containing protein [Candidatus Sericytochromatia bacterium]
MFDVVSRFLPRSLTGLFVSLSLLVLPPAPAAATILVLQAGIQVHVDGAVRSPGVFRLASASRVAEAIAAAGGARPGAALHRLNLAARLQDGDHVHVPTPTQATTPVSASPARAPGQGGSRPRRARRAPGKGALPSGAIALNRATRAQFESLPGVGPAMAERILAVRTRLGRFSSLEELREVPGIGAKRLQRLRPHLVLD